MRNPSLLWILLAVMLILDIYIFQALKFVSHSAGPRTRMVILISYWAVSALAIVTMALTPYMHVSHWPNHAANYVYAIILGLFFAKLLATVFFLADDLRRGLQWIVVKLFSASRRPAAPGAEGISRSVFVSWLGLALGGGLFSSLLYGFTNKYNYRIHRHRLSFDRLPPAFRGMKIVQISDIHSGSFTDKDAVRRGVDMIIQEKADLILFTGDLVNDKATEMLGYKEVFARLTAPMGIFSTLGNHDYGDYTEWESEAAKAANLDHLKTIHADMGWRLLMNEHVVLEKQGQEIALIGIENWSAKARFPKKGKMKEAYAGTEKYPFKVLMSHDPSHWDAEVRPRFSDVDLTLSGHTHGMQFGVEIAGFHWSPVQYIYKQWAGLYEKGSQKLYVNRGYGFLGYPGRIGILPEITIIELA